MLLLRLLQRLCLYTFVEVALEKPPHKCQLFPIIFELLSDLPSQPFLGTFSNRFPARECNLIFPLIWFTSIFNFLSHPLDLRVIRSPRTLVLGRTVIVFRESNRRRSHLVARTKLFVDLPSRSDPREDLRKQVVLPAPSHNLKSSVQQFYFPVNHASAPEIDPGVVTIPGHHRVKCSKSPLDRVVVVVRRWFSGSNVIMLEGGRPVCEGINQ